MKLDEIRKIVENFGAKLYDVEIEKIGEESIYRVLIMADGGVSVELCEKISRVLSPYMDTNPPVKGGYYLEVSSPGIERNLSKPEHFEYAIGEVVKVKATVAGKLKGKLKSVDANGIVLDNEGSDASVLFSDIQKAKTVFEWKS